MSRCTKVDAKGAGCVREAGHTGRHKVRLNPEAAYEIIAENSSGAAAGVTAGAGAGLDALSRRIEAEISGLVGDCERVVGIIRTEAGVIKARNLGLLKLAVRCRRRIARLDRSLKSARGAAAAARLAKEIEAEDETEEDDDGA